MKLECTPGSSSIIRPHFGAVVVVVVDVVFVVVVVAVLMEKKRCHLCDFIDHIFLLDDLHLLVHLVH